MSAHAKILNSILDAYGFLFSDGLEISGKTDLPAGPKIIVANHTNSSDLLYLHKLTSENFHGMFQNGLFAIPLVGWLMHRTGQICVNRQHGRPAFDAAVNYLHNGETVLLFPEGRQCRRDARIKAKNGAVRMSLETGATIIPVGFYVRPQNLVTLRAFWNPVLPPGDWQVAGKCYARFGEPWVPDPSAPLDGQTDQMMNRIYQLVDQLAFEHSIETAPACLAPSYRVSTF